MRHFVITEFVSLFYVYDFKGQKKEFQQRFASCFIITVKGKIRFSHRDGELIAQAGQPVFLPRGLHYVNECLEDAESYVFNLQTDRQTPIYSFDVQNVLLHGRTFLYYTIHRRGLTIAKPVQVLAETILKYEYLRLLSKNIDIFDAFRYNGCKKEGGICGIL